MNPIMIFCGLKICPAKCEHQTILHNLKICKTKKYKICPYSVEESFYIGQYGDKQHIVYDKSLLKEEKKETELIEGTMDQLNDISITKP